MDGNGLGVTFYTVHVKVHSGVHNGGHPMCRWFIIVMVILRNTPLFHDYAGKSTTLTNCLSLFGLGPREANTQQTTAPSLSNQACATTLPIGKKIKSDPTV